MALKALLETIDTVPDAVREHYEKDETSGKFLLKVEPVEGYALEDVSGLKATFGKEMTLRKKLEKDIARYGDLDPAKAREALEKLAELSQIDPAKEADKLASAKVEAFKAQLLEQHKGELKAREDRLAFLSGTVEKVLAEDAVKDAIKAAGGNERFLLREVLDHVKVKETDGKFSVEVVDRDGNARIGDGKGTPMSIGGLVEEYKKSSEWADAFKPANSGTSADTSTVVNNAVVKGNFGGNKSDRVSAISRKYNLPVQ